MNQQKIGCFLKKLRKNKSLTQEQLAEYFYVSARTVSRWETGSNMPDVETLIELADFYNVDIREIIDGERKSEHMDNEAKDTLKKVAEYATEEEKKRGDRLRKLLVSAVCLLLISNLLFASEHKGRLYGIIPDEICGDIMSFMIGASIAALLLYVLHCFGVLDKIGQWKKKHTENKD